MKAIRQIFEQGVWKDNPIYRQILGICSALAVTNLMMNSLVMGIGLMFVTGLSSFTVSLLRNHTPKHIRMMVQTLIISAFVIILDIYLKAYLPEMSKALGPYVGLIITNCIIMGRCEAYAQHHSPLLSLFDGITMGLGYLIVLLFIAFFRELLGFGSLFGIQILPDTFVPWTLMIMPPGAFFMLAIVIWIAKNVFPTEEEKGGTTNARN